MYTPLIFYLFKNLRTQTPILHEILVQNKIKYPMASEDAPPDPCFRDKG